MLYLQPARCSIVAQLHLAPYASGVGGSIVTDISTEISSVRNSEKDYVMEEQKTINSKSWISFRVKPDQYKIIYGHFSKTTYRKLSEYARNVLLQKPVIVKYRNESADDFLKEMLQLKKELNAIGNNYNQVLKKLHTLDRVSEIKNWLSENEITRQSFMQKTEQILSRLNQIYSQWLSE